MTVLVKKLGRWGMRLLEKIKEKGIGAYVKVKT